MSFPLKVKIRPICVHCSRKCGQRWREWDLKALRPDDWDGETWFHKYNPFCTLRCALAYARLRYSQGR